MASAAVSRSTASPGAAQSQIKAFVERLTVPLGPGPTEVGLEQAKEAAAAGQPDVAARIYEQLLREDPGNADALAGLARCEIARGRLAAAREILRAGAQGSRQLRLGRRRPRGAQPGKQVRHAGRPGPADARLAADENDHEARLDLATVLFLRGQAEPAIEHLLAVVRKDREWRDQAARKQLLEVLRRARAAASGDRERAAQAVDHPVLVNSRCGTVSAGTAR